MQYIKTSTNEIVTIKEIKAEYPNVSFGKPFMPPVGYELIHFTTPPEFDEYSNISETAPQLVDGVYRQVWLKEDIPLDDAKKLKTSEIKQAFDKEFRDGKIESSLGFMADCRRSDTKNDRENLQLRIDAGIFPINWKDAEGVDHPLTEAEAKKLSSEMGAEILNRFEKKWSLQKSIEDATSVSQLREIKW